MKRAQIEVIEVCVRQEHDVDPGKFVDRQRGRSQSLRADGKQKWNPNSNPREKNRIGQNIDAEKIDEDCGMPKPRCVDTRVAPCCRIRFRESRGNRIPTFHDRFAP